MTEEVVASSPVEYLINGVKVRLLCWSLHQNRNTPFSITNTFLFLFANQIIFALSPLIVLAYILFSAFESPEAEALKRRKKGDFELEGHGE